MGFIRTRFAVVALASAFCAAPPLFSSQAASNPAETDTSASSLTPLQLRQMIDKGRANQALRELDSPGTSEKLGPPANLLRGLAFYALNRVKEADAAFEAAMAVDSHNDEAAQMRSLTLFQLGRPAEAIPILEAAHTWNSHTKVDPSYLLGLCYLDTRNYDKARHAFATQYEFEPDSAAAYLLNARLLFRREYLPIAQESARRAIALDPQLPLAHSLLGEIALAGEHLEEATQEFEKERVRNPLDGSVYDRLGDVYTRAGQYEKAEQALQRAVLLEPNTTGPYILLGKVMLKRQDPVSASRYLERAEKMDSSNFMTHSLLGQTYRMMGRADDAARETQAAERIQSANQPKFESVH